MFRKWREKDSTKLRQLEREFEKLTHEFNMVKLSYGMLRSEYRILEKRVDAKEITHIQKVEVKLKQPSEYCEWY